MIEIDGMDYGFEKDHLMRFLTTHQKCIEEQLYAHMMGWA